MNVWYRWCLTVGEKRKLEDIPAHELNNLLSNFFFTVKKRNGEEYEPNSLTSLHRSIDRHLREVGQNTIRILEDREFEGSRQALDAKRRQLKKRGKGGKPNASEPLSYSDEDKLWETCQLGGHSPRALNRTIWFMNTMHFGWRGRDEHRKACYGDFTFGCDTDGVEYVEFSKERGTKTRTGVEGEASRQFRPRMYATNNLEKCPVTLFKKYCSLKPQECCSPDSPLYLTEANNRTDECWHKRQPVGINKLGSYMKEMCKVAGIKGQKTNHSARKTMTTRLIQDNVPPQQVAQLTGHKNLKSLDNYASASTEQQKSMSLIISGKRQALQSMTNQPRMATNTAMYHEPPSSEASSSILPGMTISSNQVVNIHFNNIACQSVAASYAPPKRKRVCVIDSSDSEAD